ncbi:MAG: GrpB family protein [Janthinobacterium lividum]
MRICMVPHDPKWRSEFEREAEQITAILGSNVVAVHHIGSTAIPSIYAGSGPNESDAQNNAWILKR